MTELKPNIHWEPYSIENVGLDSWDDDYKDDEEDDVESLDFDTKLLKEKIRKLPRVVPTPFGLCRVDDKMNPLRRFSFWIGHTNFDITKSVFEAIEETPGIEVFMVNTRYRFIIGVGTMFKNQDVRMYIEQKLCGKHRLELYLKIIQDDMVKNALKKTYDEIKSHEFWGIFVFPNGNINTFIPNDKNSFINECKFFSDASTLSGGLLLTSEDTYDKKQDIELQS